MVTEDYCAEIGMHVRMESAGAKGPLESILFSIGVTRNALPYHKDFSR